MTYLHEVKNKQQVYDVEQLDPSVCQITNKMRIRSSIYAENKYPLDEIIFPFISLAN